MSLEKIESEKQYKEALIVLEKLMDIDPEPYSWTGKLLTEISNDITIYEKKNIGSGENTNRSNGVWEE